MSDDAQWQEKVSLAFQRLSPKHGDTMVVTFPPDIAHERMSAVAEALNEEVSDGVTVLCLREGMTVDLLSEKEMNALGWHKMGTIQ